MKFFVRHNQQETGPLTRDEVFAQLREGKLLVEDEARDEDSMEWKPLMEILNKSAAKALFSVEQIEANYEPSSPPAVVVDLSPRRSSVEKEEPAWNGRKVLLWATAGMAAAFYIAFVFNQDHEATTPASSRPQAAVVAPMVKAPNASGIIAGASPTPLVRPSEPARFPEGTPPPAVGRRNVCHVYTGAANAGVRRSVSSTHHSESTSSGDRSAADSVARFPRIRKK
ncbi:MAG: hypothetical protein WDN28_24810 [Chthoniobacter sp.]